MINKKKLIILLGTLAALGPFSIDMYLSSFPAIAACFNTDIEKVSLSLSSFFIGISVGQLFYGPLIDRFGRKKPLIIGLTIYLSASIGCVFSSSITMFVLLRMIQAFGGCVGVVASRATIRDLFSVSESAGMFSSLMLVVGVSPVFAPIFGSYLAMTFGWKFIFLALSAISFVLIVAVSFALPENYRPDSNVSLKPYAILKTYGSILTRSSFYIYAFSGSIAASCFYIYLAGSPFVFMQYFQLTEQRYSLLFALIASGLIGSSQVNKVLLKKYQPLEIIKPALRCQIATGALLVVGSFFHLLNLPITVLMIFLFFCCHGFISPNCSALSLSSVDKNKGSAAALLGFFQLGFGAIASAILNIFKITSAMPMTFGMFGLSVLSFTILSIPGFKPSNQIFSLKN